MRRSLLMILFFSVLAGCGRRKDDHSNPFDPVGGIYLTDGIVQGTVTNYDGEAMSGLQVSINTISGIEYGLGSRATITNAAGFFQFTEMIVDVVCWVDITSPADYVETFGGNYRVTPQSYVAVDTSVQVGRISAQTPGSVWWDGVETDYMSVNLWIAQSFKPTGSPLRAATIWTNSIVSSVCADDNGTPGAVLGTVEGNSYEDVDSLIPLSSEIPVTIGSTYWLLFGDGTKESSIEYSIGNPYSDGTMKASDDSGATWDVEEAAGGLVSDFDVLFAVYY